MPIEAAVRAIDGEPGALEEIAGSETTARVAVERGLGPALAIGADRARVEVPEIFRQALTESISAWLLVDRAVGEAGEALAQVGVAWVPIKGYDVGTRFYREREARPIADLDLLVAEDDFEAARHVFEAAGWRGLGGGTRERAYLREEGYAWQASGPLPVTIELHFRLWGTVPAALPGAMLDRATPDPGLGVSARRLAPEDAYLLAAVHAWTKQRPRSATDWLDLRAVARHAQPQGPLQEGGTYRAPPVIPTGASPLDSPPFHYGSLGAGSASGAEGSRLVQQEGGTYLQEGGTLAERVIEAAGAWGLELPVVLSATVADGLWPGGVHGEIVGALSGRLRGAERLVRDRLLDGGPETVSYRDVVLARLLARRPSRMGWRSVWRRVWPHPGVVERETPATWSWPRRRWASLLRRS